MAGKAKTKLFLFQHGQDRKEFPTDAIVCFRLPDGNEFRCTYDKETGTLQVRASGIGDNRGLTIEPIMSNAVSIRLKKDRKR